MNAYPTPSWDAVLASEYGMSVLVEGQYQEGKAGAETVFDFIFKEARQIQGGDISAWKMEPGDSVSVTVLSPFDPETGKPVDPPVEVRQVAKDARLLANGSWSLRVGYSMDLPVGAIFRVTYRSTGATAPLIAVNLMTWLEGTGL